MSFKNAVKKTPKYSFTANGALTHATSGSYVLDLFFLAGASRGKNLDAAIDAALGEDVDRTIRTCLWMRDIRGGAGERQTFRDALTFLCKKEKYDILGKIMPIVPIVGRWDDLLVFKDTTLDPRPFIMDALKEGNALCAKWMPRQGPYAEWLRGDMTPRQWRKLVVGLSNTVEQLMCAKKWDEIEFKKLPSLAASRYQNAFKKHCPHYEVYKKALTKGETTVNASAIFPHDVIKGYFNGDKVVSQAQWDALPNYIPEGLNILPVVDVSGSMNMGHLNPSPLHVALALGMYCSEKAKGPFHNLVCTFSNTSDIYELSGDIGNRIAQLNGMAWNMNTNLQAAVAKVLTIGVHKQVPDADMPKMLLVISDMEFDVCGGDKTNYSAMKDQYKAHGYTFPNIVFWNVNARAGNFPVRMHKTGTALISGYSPSILKSLLRGEQISPKDIMDATIMNERYNWND